MSEFQLQVLHYLQSIDFMSSFVGAFVCFFIVVIYIDMSDR